MHTNTNPAIDNDLAAHIRNLGNQGTACQECGSDNDQDNVSDACTPCIEGAKTELFDALVLLKKYQGAKAADTLYDLVQEADLEDDLCDLMNEILQDPHPGDYEPHWIA